MKRIALCKNSYISLLSSGAHPALYQMGAEGSLHRGKAVRV